MFVHKDVPGAAVRHATEALQRGTTQRDTKKTGTPYKIISYRISKCSSALHQVFGGVISIISNNSTARTNCTCTDYEYKFF